ncbi:hypothetical protein AB0N17_12235 [Streptomyces sp. NPDC051133]|uniref:LppU/SCO3897 family protein n=1 Tax=Streptomyces sp. NPDC051133 TaxID=3155521 RepID=UPI00342353BE
MIVMMRFLRRRGVLCRTCGLAIFRKMQADTLLQGWWGAMSVVITPITLLINLGALSRIRKLPAPVTAARRPPLDPGRPVFKRPAGLFGLLPIAAFAGMLLVALPVLVFVGATSDDSGSDGATGFAPTKAAAPVSAGDCARNDGTLTHWDLKKVPCAAADAQFRVKAPKDGLCTSGEYVADVGTDLITVCLQPVK